MLFNIDALCHKFIHSVLCFIHRQKRKTIIFYRNISLFLSKYYIFAAFLEKYNKNNNKYYGQYTDCR